MNQEFLSEFDTATRQLLGHLNSVDETTLNQQIKPGSWSAAQIGEHLYKSFSYTNILYGQVEPSKRNPAEKLKQLTKLFLDFSVKMEAPEAVRPSKKQIDKQVLLKGLKKRIEQQRTIITEEDLDMICLDYAIPEYGPFTRREWIGFNLLHIKRHNQQLKNILKALK